LDTPPRFCSLVRGLTRIEGWPHILEFGHQLAKVLSGHGDLGDKSDVISHLTRGKVAALSCAHSVRSETPGIFDYQGLPVAVQLPWLSSPHPVLTPSCPHPILSSPLHRGLLGL
uniref:Uncharacterized protein n=1 Tax=Suricata suricatta TaxID=37032 RepID=A0A673VIT1_SURSU